MGNPLIDQLTWIAIQLYNRTYAKIPAFIFDIDTKTNPKGFWLVVRKPRMSTIPWLTVYIVNITVTLIGAPMSLLHLFDSKNLTTLLILTTSIVILHWFILWYVSSSLHALWQTSHCIAFINFVINNRLTYRKSGAYLCYLHKTIFKFGMSINFGNLNRNPCGSQTKCFRIRRGVFNDGIYTVRYSSSSDHVHDRYQLYVTNPQ